MTEQQLDYIHDLLNKRLYFLENFEVRNSSDLKSHTQEIKLLKSTQHDLLFVESSMDNYENIVD